MIKRAGVFYFADEPQFATYASRAWLANRMRAWRSARGNLGAPMYTVRREKFGKYTVQLRYTGSPVAIILMHGA